MDSSGLESYHYVWLKAHPLRTVKWLKERLSDGFHIHHVDGNHGNDDPSNLILIDGCDHLTLHGGAIKNGIKLWRSGVRQDRTENRRDYHLRIDLGSWRAVVQANEPDRKFTRLEMHDASGRISNRVRSWALRKGMPWPPCRE